MGTNQKKTPEGEPIPAGTRAESSIPPVLLPGIHSPADLKALPEDKMPELCREIRGELLRTVTRTGGTSPPISAWWSCPWRCTGCSTARVTTSFSMSDTELRS